LATLWARFLRLPDDGGWGVTNGRPFNFDVITEKIVLGRLPRNLADIDTLVKQTSVGAVITLNESWELFLTEAQVKGKGLRVITLPAPDYGAPTLQQIVAGVEFMAKQIGQGRPVYVHCNGGKGRSTVIVLAYLMSVRCSF
jgi:atypical dual specificity phosphatase